MIKIIADVPEPEVLSYFDFFKMKRETGFGFVYFPEPALGIIMTLHEDKSRSVNCDEQISMGENQLIIGDNYNALKSLPATHQNRIKIIYTDPPHNTDPAQQDGNQPLQDRYVRQIYL